MNPAPLAIRCHGLGKAFDNIRAVQDAHLEVQRGDFVALLGPSGCGKTTVLRLLAGLESPDTGCIEINGQPVADSHTSLPPEKRKIGMVFQEYALFPHLSVRDNIAFGLRGAANKEQRVDQVLELVDLMSVQHRGPHTLSGGQQQRVAIARALAPGPEVILLDEPFSNLDAALRQRVREEIRAILLQAGVTSIFVTHDQEEALSLSDHLAVMLDGQIRQFGPPRELYAFPVSQPVAAFLGDTNFLPADAHGKQATSAIGRVELHHPCTGPITIMTRPENISLAAHPQGRAVILSRSFLGHSWIFQVQLPCGSVLRSRVSGACPALDAGSLVSLSVQGPVMAYPLP